MPTTYRALRDTLSKTRARVRTRGASEVLGEVGGRVRNSIGSRDEIVFLHRPATWNGHIARKTDEPLELARATAADGNDYERFIGTDSARTFARRLSEHTDCWLVRARGMILHATWTTSGAAWTSEIKRLFVPPPKSAYIYESFTRVEARGLGLYPFALVGIGDELAADGLTDLYVGVEVDNAPSLRAITKAGFVPAFNLGFARRFGRLHLEEPTGPRAELAQVCLRTR